MPNSYGSMNAIDIIRAFYELEAIDVLAKDNPFRHSHARWRKDFNEFRQLYTDKLEQAIYDYTVLVCAGELRHAKSKANFYNPHYFTSENKRHAVFNEAFNFTIDSIIKNSLHSFSKTNWKSSYGGKAWAKIAQAAKKRNEWNNKVLFIDHCVDLSHNSNAYFDKADSGIFYLDNGNVYREMLDRKRNMKPEDFLDCYYHCPIVTDFMFRAMNIGVMEERKLWLSNPDYLYNQKLHNEISVLLNYQPKQWGTKEIPFEFVPVDNSGYDCDDGCDDCPNTSCKDNPDYEEPEIIQITNLQIMNLQKKPIKQDPKGFKVGDKVIAKCNTGWGYEKGWIGIVTLTDNIYSGGIINIDFSISGHGVINGCYPQNFELYEEFVELEYKGEKHREQA